MKKRKQFSRAQMVWGDRLRKDLRYDFSLAFTTSVSYNITLANILFNDLNYGSWCL